ncbi:Cytochrome c-type biogenesis protein [Mucinivorans hirudinis]|uniref:Cytochrome c-type biogenesis protein n=1 Tax=Mucinivorans hirudinis TaxID=1433126 RepID=A0A060R7D8_9BACT|nr:Cytochrome c-type biogenesis protein [Mucinivorans hirudinis]
MKKLLLSLFALLTAVSAMAQVENPVSWRITAAGDKVTFTAQIESPWYMYDLGPYKDGPNPTTFKFAMPEGVSLNGTIKPLSKGKKVQDEIFKMEIGYYLTEAVFEQQFYNGTGTKQKIKVNIEWQCCDGESCLPPTDEDFEFVVEPSSVSDAPVTVGEDPARPIDAEMLIDGNTAGVAADVESEPRGSMWSIIIQAMLLGLAALLTPCVFPMIPMTVTFFLRRSGSKARGKFLAIFYGLSIIAVYTLPIAAIILITYFVGGDAVTADIFNWLATHWIPNILFFLIFLVFGFSFLGAFELTLPSKWVNKSDTAADKGGLVGTFFMATTLVLVSFSCTGPIVGSILVKSTQGEVWEPIITMLAFSSAFAIPFAIFAFFPELLKNLPQSGGWLNSVKVVLGFVVMALGLKFLSVADLTYHWNLISREVFLAIWIVIFSLLGLYLLGKLRFSHDDPMEFIPVKRLVLAICTFSFVVYLIPGMWGAPLTALSGYLPPMYTQDYVVTQGGGSFDGSANQEKSSIDHSIAGKPKYADFLHLPYGIEGFFDYEQGMEYARKIGKPVFIDFVGHSCSKCKAMEANVWKDPAVLKYLKNDYVVIALYVDDKKELPENEWVTDEKGKVLKTLGKINSMLQIAKFNINAQPYYVLMNPFTEKELAKPRSYDTNIDAYVQFLEEGVKAFTSQQ